MKRSRLIAVFFSLAVSSMSASALASIPFFNATCPHDVSVHADAGGPVYINGRETQLNRVNENYTEARDARSGVTLSISRSPDGDVQVSYTGPNRENGICKVAPSSAVSGATSVPAAADSTRAPREVTCESQGDKQTECAMDTRGDVRLVRQLSRTRCEQGDNWGLNRHSIWVKDGCRAVFRTVSGDAEQRPAHAHAASGGDAVLLGACNTRARADGALVTRLPVNDEVMELIVDYPDGRYLCMVKNDGMVESLTRLRGGK